MAPSGVSMTTFVPSGFAAESQPPRAIVIRVPIGSSVVASQSSSTVGPSELDEPGLLRNCDVPASVYEPPSARPVGDVSLDTGPAGGRVEEQQRPLRVTRGGDGLTVGAVDERDADLTALLDLSEHATASDVDEGDPAECGVVVDGDDPTVGAERGVAAGECDDVAVAEAVLLSRTTGVGDVPEHDGGVGARDGGEDRPGRAPCHPDRSRLAGGQDRQDGASATVPYLHGAVDIRNGHGRAVGADREGRARDRTRVEHPTEWLAVACPEAEHLIVDPAGGHDLRAVGA